MDLSVIIVNYNTTEHLSKTLRSIYSTDRNLTIETIVVDNNSTEGNVDWLFKEFPSIRLFKRNSNDGFGAASNFGAKAAVGKYFVFVNPDIILSEATLSVIFRFMENNSRIGVSSGVLFGEDGKNVYTYNYFPDINWEFSEAMGKGSEKKIQNLLKNERIVNQSVEELEVDWVMGAFMFIRADVFRMVDGFDERFFLYYEDVDLQKRIKSLGYRIVVLPYVKIFHYERSSVRSEEGENIYYFNMNKSKMIYLYKHFGFFKRNFIRLMHIAGFLFRMITLPFRKKFREKKAQKMKQYFFILRLYFSTREKIIKSNYLGV